MDPTGGIVECRCRGFTVHTCKGGCKNYLCSGISELPTILGRRQHVRPRVDQISSE